MNNVGEHESTFIPDIGAPRLQADTTYLAALPGYRFNTLLRNTLVLSAFGLVNISSGVPVSIMSPLSKTTTLSATSRAKSLH
jgi:hypothetical protein